MSGNPAGRKKGGRNKALIALDQIGAANAERLVNRAIELALAGDTVALKILLDRVYPIRKGRPVEIDLPPLGSASDLPAALAAVVSAVSKGQLTPDEAASVTAILDAHSRAIEIADLDKRIRQLEEQNDELPR